MKPFYDVCLDEVCDDQHDKLRLVFGRETEHFAQQDGLVL